MQFLIKTDYCICGDIVDEPPLAQPTVSQHLIELKSAGLIEGNEICYCVNPIKLNMLKDFIITKFGVKNCSY